jgi:hypothetical protein
VRCSWCTNGRQQRTRGRREDPQYLVGYLVGLCLGPRYRLR